MRNPRCFHVPKVLVDTSILRNATSGRVILVERDQEVTWGDRTFNVAVAEPMEDDRVERLSSDHSRLKSEVRSLKAVFRAARQDRILLLVSDCVGFESWNLRNLADGRGLLQGAPFLNVKGPIEPTFTIGGTVPFKTSLVNGLLHSNDDRFKELQSQCGALRGDGQEPDENQILDAYHFWTAEFIEADYFLTTDFKLVKRLRGQPDHQSSVEIVMPSELLEKLPRNSLGAKCARVCAKLWPL